MADSLRDQLLQAGFKQKPSEPGNRKPRGAKPGGGKKNKRSGSGAQPNGGQPRAGNAGARQGNKPSAKAHNVSAAEAKKAEDAALAEQRRAIKGKIKVLIEDHAVKEYTGETVYRFTLQNRIRELHVSEPIRQQLVDNQLIITRLNGTTYLVPEAISHQIRELNPNWAIVAPKEASSDNVDGYDDFPIPDDIIW